jgi:hypothetical protein
MLLCKVDKHLVIDLTSAYNHNVLAEIVCSVEVNNHFPVDLPDVINISKNWLAHHMIPKAVVVHILHQSFLRVLVHSLQL